MTILQSTSVFDTVTAWPRPAETDRPVEVLVADDEPLFGKSLTKMLTDLGHRVTLVTDATSALQSISSGNVDVLITDYEMPRLNGRELLDIMGSDYPLIPVLVLTGHEDLALAVQLLRAGAVDFLTKPFQPNRFSGPSKGPSMPAAARRRRRTGRAENADGGADGAA